ncbi:MAG: metallophosphoesterase [Calditrichaeota bacterium]|nr:MAG: metallophosphoesterase [Calditrichota bacterium]
MRIVLFYAFITGILITVQWVLWRRFTRWLSRAFPAQVHLGRRLMLGVFLVGNAAFAARLTVSRLGFYGTDWAQMIVRLAGLFGASIALAFLLLVMYSLLLAPFRLPGWWRRRKRHTAGADSERPSEPDSSPASPEVDIGRRRFLQLSGGVFIGASLGLPAVGALVTSYEYTVRRVPLYFPHMPPGLEGLTIAQISDIHAGAFMTERHIREIVELINGLHPHLIVITGDFVDSSEGEIPSIYHTVGELKAEYGVFGCLGNHDHYANAAKVDSAVRQRGVIMLNNAHRVLRINGEELALVGVDDAGRGFANHADINRAVAGLPPEGFRILISHRPTFFPVARRHGMELTLSGHTHGGQVGVRVLGTEIYPVRMFHTYPKGHFVEDGKQLYVSTGVGVVGGMPIRTLEREITLFTLHTGELRPTDS